MGHIIPMLQKMERQLRNIVKVTNAAKKMVKLGRI